MWANGTTDLFLSVRAVPLQTHVCRIASDLDTEADILSMQL
jgi:hypothetical protein